MAQRGRRLEEWMQRSIQRLAQRLSLRQTAREVGVALNTAWKYSGRDSRKKKFAV